MSDQKIVSDTMLKARENSNLGSRGLKIKRVYTKQGEDRYAGIEFVKTTSKITNPDGSSVFEMNNIEVPKSWSQVATDILAQKYFRRKGVPLKDVNDEILKDEKGVPLLGGETSAKQTIDRLAGAWRWWGEKYGYFDSKEDADSFEDEIAYMLMTQISAPNSPQWFNTGLNWAYGITGNAQGHWYVDPDSKQLKQSEDAYTRTQAHACFILSIQDDLVNEGGVYDMLMTEARIFKYGSGSGINFSNLRGEGEPLSGGGKSSGLMSFLQVFDRGAGAIKSGGTTRRAAKMVCLNMDHPEIETFIRWKVVEEQKVAALVAGSYTNYKYLKEIMESAEKNGVDPERNPDLKKIIKKANDSFVPLNYIKRVLMLVENGMKSTEFSVERYDTDFRSDAYLTVGGQNSNNSVRVPNNFFEALEKKSDWNLINRTDKKISKTLKASDLWREVVNSAWQSADPGVQYDTTINEWHTCPEDGRINGSNPCSEYMFLDDTACNLASLNLIKFYDNRTKKFDVESFRHATRLWTIVLEISVLMAHLPTKTVAEKTFLFRTLGLGYGNLGALLMQQGIPYESEKGYAFTGAITALMGGESYATSAEMAKVQGPFERYHKNRESMLRVIRNHRRAIYGASENEYEGLTIKPMKLNEQLIDSALVQSAKEVWDYALELGNLYGFRNAQTTLIAPTGTIGLLMDFDTTGVEPDFALVKFKKLVGGGYFKIVNQSVRPGLETLGYSENEIDAIEKYIIGHSTLNGAPYINLESLKEKGFTTEQLMLIEGRLPTAYDLRSAFSKWSLGDEFLTEKLHIPFEKLSEPQLDVLSEIGFTKEQIEKAEEFICGTMMIEGAPFLKIEHYSAFDCANRCGAKGKRYISTIGHLKQMAAAQPFLSGAISKTVNLPEEATFKDIEDAYLEGWKLMLKSNALYRDGSKLSQPLNTGGGDSSYAKLFDFSSEDEIVENVTQVEVQKIIEKEIIQVPRRKKLPDERHSLTHKFAIAGHEGYMTVGLFEDGTPGELFITMSSAGSFLSGMMDAFAVSTSLNLQYGVPVEVLVRKFTEKKFEPSGMTSNKEIPLVKSIIDYIGRWFALKFLDIETAKLYHNEELIEKSYKEGSKFKILTPYVNGKGHTEVKSTKYVTVDITSNLINEHIQSLTSTSIESEPIQIKLEDQIVNRVNDNEYSMMEKISKAKNLGFTGDICTTCGSMNVKRNGSCNVCTDCGTTTGCS